MKKIGIIAIVGIVLLVGGFFVARHLAIGFLTPEFLVQKIEEQWNCRAEVSGLKVRLLGKKSGLELFGVRLATRDEFAEKGTPLAERPPMEKVEVSVELAKLEVELGDLLKRRISIRQLLIKDVTINTRIRKNGRPSVQDLFESPRQTKIESGEVKTADKAKETKPAAVKSEGGEGVVVQVNKGKEGFSAKDMGISTFADSVEMQNGSINATIESGSSLLSLSNMQLKLSQIEVDPSDLLKHNHAAFSFSGDLVVEDGEKKVKQISVSLAGDGEVRPFDPSSGKIDPSWVSNLTIKKGSTINTFPMVDKLKELLSGVDTAGVDLSDLQVGGVLTKDASTRLKGHAGKFLLEKNLALPLPDTDFVFARGCWLDAGANQHYLKGSVMASDALTAKLTKKVDSYLKKKAKNFYSDSLKDLVLQPAMRDGRIAFDFVSKGDLGKPKVDIITPFGNLTELIDQGKQTIESLKDVGKSLLKGLFGK
ncbi:MAG: hypothetical protein QM496_21995 [Verrucomicrobiota bacterium]